jgi:hypothetical protein
MIRKAARTSLGRMRHDSGAPGQRNNVKILRRPDGQVAIKNAELET